MQALNGSLHNAACKLFGSWRETVEAAGFDYDEVNLYADRRHWSTEDIVREISTLHAQREDLKASTIRDNHADLFNAARRDPKLGTWEAAIGAAGLVYDEVMGERWGSGYVGKDGFAYASEIEGKVGDKLFKLRSKKTILDYRNQVRVVKGRAWTCDFVIDLTDGGQLWLEVDGLGEAREDGPYSDSHEKIVHYKESGVEYAIVRSPPQAEKVIRNREERKRNLAVEYDAPRNLVELGGNRYTDEELLSELKRVCDQLGRPPSQAEMKEIGLIWPATIRRRLGWAEACAEVGYPIRKKSELILEDVKRVIESLGRVPTQAEYLRLGRYGSYAISSHLGSYDRAVILAGYEPPPKRRTWNPENVIATIRELSTHTPILRPSKLSDMGLGSLHNAARRHFGTWENAMKAANVPIAGRQKLETWARDFDACVECGQTRLRHAGMGLCSSCYSKMRRQR